jgi:hypothetical protein
MASKELRAALRAPFAQSEVKNRPGPGGKKLDYVAGETVLNRLLDLTANEDSGYAWVVTSTQYTQTDNGWAAVVSGQLHIQGDTGGGVGAMVNADLDMAVKSANTEAIKNAAKNGFGIGLELWDAEYRTQLDQRRRAAGGNEQALKSLVWDVAKRKLGTAKPAAADVAKLFNVSAGDLSDPDTLAEILAEEGIGLE